MASPDFVDLTQEDNKDQPPAVIILDDFIGPPPGRQRNIVNRANRRIEVVDVVDSEEDSTSDLVEPIRKRRPLTVSSTPRRRAPRNPPETPETTLKCPICIETFKNIKLQGTKCVVTKCGHLFCESCLKKSLAQSNRKCPKCRKQLPKGPSAMIEVFDLC